MAGGAIDGWSLCFTVFLVCTTLFTALKNAINYVFAVWIAPVLPVSLFRLLLNYSFNNSVFCLSSSPLPQRS